MENVSYLFVCCWFISTIRNHFFTENGFQKPLLTSSSLRKPLFQQDPSSRATTSGKVSLFVVVSTMNTSKLFPVGTGVS